ncbi:MAG: molybdopterin containing oxidoreductase, partial [Flavobacteriaceae bacterium]
MKRRIFIKNSTLGVMAAAIGVDIVHSASLPEGYLPLAFQDPDPFKLFNKDQNMVVLNERPWNIEAQAHLLDDRVTPNKYMFIRNNGLIPENIDASKWTLTIDGEAVQRSKTYT